MKCQTCGQTFRDIDAKNWGGRLVCPTCFGNLSTVAGSLMIREVQRQASELGYEVTDEQAFNIVANQNASQTLIAAPLTPAERKVAEELYYLRVKELMSDEVSSGNLTDAQARELARNSVAWGEQGPTRLQKIGHASGCFQGFLGIVGLMLLSMLLYALGH